MVFPSLSTKYVSELFCPPPIVVIRVNPSNGLAKIICDTSYLGWLINYAQLSNMIAIQYGVDYDEMWNFSDEIHKILGNRPKMYPGFIGGHCVIPNLDLMHNMKKR